MENKLIGSSSPHIRTDETTQKLMLDVVIALLPALVASIFYFGFNSLILVIASVVSAVVTEYICQRIMKKPITVTDLSAVVTGILLAFNIPPTAPWWIPVLGSAFAIAIAKQIFGGIGFNFINPALAGRAFLMASWNPHLTTGWIDPVTDAVSSATPLSIIKGSATGELPSLFDMLVGNIPGVLGETSALLLLAGGIYLIYRGVIKWIIPVFYIGTVAILALFVDGGSMMLYHVLGGGLMLGAFFMATDYVTCPITDRGKVIYAIGAGILTMIIRKIGGYPEGVSYSILLMNILTPLIDKYVTPKLFGGAK
ncbi:RnfABCDGE type electron transport complex subunit D [Sedimentibacter sp. MB31-C6]|uniref:RnfABCDGE type electron transport complex subunit D n=1 Tax=Sedimentibacter sp. MB31-C6 TaxID=3109366 RepID=UPI002DDD7D42|nr:RnfABCDGE type electron transport complex subunit D [Sedimentibacter sp. MB36-C1]WSI04369.1 RnfABCDGE type electron transport complex subunit D [Sedimentibacter sp. MB36-C1]